MEEETIWVSGGLLNESRSPSDPRRTLDGEYVLLEQKFSSKNHYVRKDSEGNITGNICYHQIGQCWTINPFKSASLRWSLSQMEQNPGSLEPPFGEWLQEKAYEMGTSDYPEENQHTVVLDRMVFSSFFETF